MNEKQFWDWKEDEQNQVVVEEEKEEKSLSQVQDHLEVGESNSPTTKRTRSNQDIYNTKRIELDDELSIFYLCVDYDPLTFEEAC